MFDTPEKEQAFVNKLTNLGKTNIIFGDSRRENTLPNANYIKIFSDYLANPNCQTHCYVLCSNVGV